jgi:antirestriction protein ArdC
MKQNVRETITNKIIKALEQGQIPWICPFEKQQLPVNYKTGKEYRGMNLMLLWLESMMNGFTGNYWLGFKQAQSMGGKVKKGEHGTPIIVCCPFSKTEKDKRTGEEKEIHGNYFKTDYVFNLYSQVEGIEFEPVTAEYKPLEGFDKLVLNMGVKIRNSGERAYYSPDDDLINMPFYSKFKTQEDYYDTLAHELVHSTLHPDRLAREFKGGDERALEELIAEIGGAFLCAEFGLKTNIQNNAGYVQSWLKSLKDDSSYIFKAAKHASEAVNYILECKTAKEKAAA